MTILIAAAGLLVGYGLSWLLAPLASAIGDFIDYLTGG